MIRVANVAMLSLPVLLCAGIARGKVIEFTYRGTIEYAYYEPDTPFVPITLGSPWTAHLLFDNATANQYPPDVYDQSVAVYQGISLELAIGSALITFTPVTISVANNADLSNHGGPFLDCFDVVAGPSAELYLSFSDRTLAANRSTELPSSIMLEDWPNRDIVFSRDGYLTGSIEHIAARIVPEPATLTLAALGLALVAIADKRRGYTRSSFFRSRDS